MMATVTGSPRPDQSHQVPYCRLATPEVVNIYMVGIVITHVSVYYMVYGSHVHYGRSLSGDRRLSWEKVVFFTASTTILWANSGPMGLWTQTTDKTQCQDHHPLMVFSPSSMAPRLNFTEGERLTKDF